MKSNTHKPFDPTVSYCNFRNSARKPWNIAYYLHDCGYSNPYGRSRAKIDRQCYELAKEKGDPQAKFNYVMMRTFGWISWMRCRANDRRQK